MSTLERSALVTERLKVLAPTHFELIDESHLHAGHAGASTGASHFRLRIGSNQFSGLTTLAKHRLVYEHIQDLIPYPIHALAIEIK